MGNNFGFWQKHAQRIEDDISIKEREKFFLNLSNAVYNAKDAEERASIWWHELFCGKIKGTQSTHDVSSIDMTHVLSEIDIETKNLCAAFLTAYRVKFFGQAGEDSRIIILKNTIKELPSNKGNEFYGPYKKNLPSSGQYGMLSIKFGDKQYQESLLRWVRETVLRLNSDIGQNLIVYGAPGTGKSYWVNHYNDEKRQKEKMQDIAIDARHITRVVFHPEYTFFDFVGSYRPCPVYRETENTKQWLDVGGKSVENFPGKPYIDYRFVPGPFTKVLVNALNDSNNMYTLLIEELNRADAAAVFGDVFQLLDRNEDGESEYPIEPSEEWLSYFEKALVDCEDILNDIKEKGVRIPNNMNIIATMNSADQGVHLLDTAFKRRWRYKYISVNQAITKIKESKEEIFYKTSKIIFKTKNDKEKPGEYLWLNFIDAINEKIAKEPFHIPEDCWIGPYFATEQELNENNGEAAIEKVLFYLWDDVLRNLESRKEFFADNVNSLGAMIDTKSYKEAPVIKGLIINDDKTAGEISEGERE